MNTEKTFTAEKHTGYVVGNSILAAEVTPTGRMYSNIRYNPSSFNWAENYIRETGEAGFEFVIDGKKYADNELSWNVEEKVFPVYRAWTQVSGLKIKVKAFAPIKAFDEIAIFTPAIVTTFSFENETDMEKEIILNQLWKVAKLTLPEAKVIDDEVFNAVFSGISFITSTKGNDFCARNKDNDLELETSYTLEAKSEKKIVFAFGNYHAENKHRNDCPEIADICSYIHSNTDMFSYAIDEFISYIPTVCSDKIAEYTRWYIQASVLLTKADKRGHLITMGYNELNQRDSFWTSFMHLVLFPDLEKRMIEVSCSYIRPDGKIPTTVLPVIERNFDIDINEYFCLRIARYYNFHKDIGFLRACFEYYKRAVLFIVNMDKDNDGLPEQCPPENPDCFWADWKDVSYIVGRKLAPHFSLLWLAVLKEGAKLARVLGDEGVAADYDARYKRAFEKINKPYTGNDEGGLWKDDHYAETWYDGRIENSILQDQTVGMFFDVVPADKVELIYKALRNNETEFGVRETYPYRAVSVDPAGTYHNGGIWPWLMFCDMTGRFKYGKGKDAVRFIEKLGYYDLEAPGDMRPNEYLHADTGENKGFEVQGWSSALLGTIYFGLFEINNDDGKINIKVNYTGNDFETKLVLPEGKGIAEISCRNSVVTVKIN